MKLLIAGGGIGGLCAALAARERNAQVCLFEKYPPIPETATSAGVQLSPNAVKFLCRWGLRERLAAIATEPLAATIRHYKTNDIYMRQPLRARCRREYAAPYWQFYRPDLVQALREAAIEKGVEINYGADVRGYSQDKYSAQLLFHNRGAVGGNIIIGADGLHSTIRQQMLGDEALRYGGAVAYRGVIKNDFARPPFPPDANIWAGRGKHFVAYYLRGGELINFVGVVARKNPIENFNASPQDLAKDLQKDFADACAPIKSICEAAQEVQLWNLYDRPLNHVRESTICDGFITLLGDAAHPILPFAAQGAALAIEDGAIMASAICHSTNYAAINTDYQHRRRLRTRKIQRMARRAMTLYHAPAAIKSLALTTPIISNLIIKNQMDYLYDFT